MTRTRTPVRIAWRWNAQGRRHIYNLPPRRHTTDLVRLIAVLLAQETP